MAGAIQELHPLTSQHTELARAYQSLVETYVTNAVGDPTQENLKGHPPNHVGATVRRSDSHGTRLNGRRCYFAGSSAASRNTRAAFQLIAISLVE